MSAFPPHRSQASIPVSADTALSHLQNYLAATKTSPYLLPNARLELSGPSAGSTNASVTIHNLQRVEAGLRGEWLAPVLDIEEAVPVAVGGLENGGDVQIGDKMETDGWQDLDEYQREQEDLEGEIVPGNSGATMEADLAEVKETEPTSKAVNPKDKEARRAEKKARQKAEVKAKHEAVRLAAEAAARES
ncbi:hypothetical protein BP6252_10468 [Coleophoma cylindrospora]|uniref:Uncharacterized protein n=1 Tax=Coleophoma cylindrospora TaxID=1849047 RepID=A0A3D8QSR2_9HELO|nr:hypothetical protein BP6252_10468 [Coleophoma cylindrospora]